MRLQCLTCLHWTEANRETAQVIYYQAEPWESLVCFNCQNPDCGQSGQVSWGLDEYEPMLEALAESGCPRLAEDHCPRELLAFYDRVHRTSFFRARYPWLTTGQEDEVGRFRRWLAACQDQDDVLNLLAACAS